jgi:hypothetical protein
MGDPLRWRAAVRDLEYMLPTYAPEHNYIVHDGERPLPDYIKEFEFDGIVLGPTFLCNRYNSKEFTQCLKDYDFIRTSKAFKIALPQDDYDCSAILDKWMTDWIVDLVFSVCPDHWSVLYPTFSKLNSIRLGYTGYVSDSMIELWYHTKPYHFRSIDVSYRANNLPPNFGRIGVVKGQIGAIFASKVSKLNLVLDISTDPKDMIPGNKWHAFMEDSKFCLATNSGSSLLDPQGLIRSCVKKYLALYPLADFEDVEEHCFKGEDGKYVFTAISPRNIEAALAQTVQIATVGSYNGLLLPEEHYISLEPDCSNIAEALAMMRDVDKVDCIARKCKEAILSVDDLRYKNHVAKIIDVIESGASKKKVSAQKQEIIKRISLRYRDDFISTHEQYWQKRRLLNKIHNVAVRLGAKKLKNIFMYRLS